MLSVSPQCEEEITWFQVEKKTLLDQWWSKSNFSTPGAQKEGAVTEKWAKAVNPV